MRKNDAFVAKIVNTGLTKIFIAIFAPDERLPSSATLLVHEVSGVVWKFFYSKTHNLGGSLFINLCVDDQTTKEVICC